jgi:hypothetical protein
MKHRAESPQITEAEMRFAASRERTRVAVNVLRSTIQTKFARPSTLAWAAGAGIVIGKFLMGPKKRPPVRIPNGLAATGIAAALLSRFGWKFLTGAALNLWLSRRRARQPRQSRMTPPPPSRTSARATGETLH